MSLVDVLTTTVIVVAAIVGVIAAAAVALWAATAVVCRAWHHTLGELERKIRRDRHNAAVRRAARREVAEHDAETDRRAEAVRAARLWNLEEPPGQTSELTPVNPEEWNRTEWDGSRG